VGLRRLGWHLGVLGSAVLKALVGCVLAGFVGHEVLIRVLGGGLLGLVGSGGALAPEEEAQSSEADGCGTDTTGIDAGFCAGGEGFPFLGCGLFGDLVESLKGG